MPSLYALGSGDTLLIFWWWSGVAMGYRIPAAFLDRWGASHAAYKVEMWLRHRAMQKL